MGEEGTGKDEGEMGRPGHGKDRGKTGKGTGKPELQVAELLENHYDPANLRSIQERISKKSVRNVNISLTSLDPDDLVPDILPH
eukprot:618903-Hanusia_phi.AAC.1